MDIPMDREAYESEVRKKISWFERAVDGLTSHDERTDMTNRLLIELIKQVSTLTGLQLIERKNPDLIDSQVKRVKVAGTAEQLPDITIPYDHEVTIKALSTNAGIVYVGNSKLAAEDTTKSFPLTSGGSVEYKIRNLKQLWVNVTVSDEGIVWTVEQNKREEI